MQVKTHGIILHTIKYSDSASILAVYTMQFGRVSYLVRGMNKKKSAFRSGLLQPLSLLEMDVSHMPGKDLQRIREMQVSYPFTSIPYHPVKNAIALFLAEALYRILRQTEPDEGLYLFLEESLKSLDASEEGFSNFHLVFLMRLTRHLGFEPNQDAGTIRYFDLMNGIFVADRPLHAHYVLPEFTGDFAALLGLGYDDMKELRLTRQKRMKLLEILIEYYKLHVPDFHGMQSLAVMQSLFD